MCADSVSNERDRVRELLQVARMYYEQEMDQGDIAERMNCSRSRVSRLLKEAREKQMVRTTVHHPLEQSFELERKLRRKLGLERVYVAPQETGARPEQTVGRLAAETIARAGHRQTALALSNGRAVAAVVDAMPQQQWPLSMVCQMIGSYGGSAHHLLDSPDLCRRMAGRLGGGYRALPVPIVLRSATAARGVRREEMVVTTLELAARADIAVVGVGAVGQGPTSELLRPFMTSELVNELRRQGAVAHISGHHFDAHGRHVPTALCERTIAMEPERLASIKLPMLVAWGSEKVPAIYAVVRSGLNLALTTDEATATMLLSYQP
ncbi:sugar-binding transcriptional regulator [Dermabacteraceae bacterium P13115]|nr:hypothetical protein [Dermabacteraceae bacterium TAE3-ERU5]